MGKDNDDWDYYTDPHHRHRGEEMISGEIIILGSDQLVINLFRKDAPGKVEVHFKHPKDIIPCNPQHEDSLSWSVSAAANGMFQLTISWTVSASREIVWAAYW